MKKIFKYILFLLIIPSFVNAQVFSEIMYDPEGTDTGREWVEIYNNTDIKIDLSKYKLFEANTKHGIVFVTGSQLVGPGGFAVITDNAEKFITDYPNFSGNLFDSAFSLNNTGEFLDILNLAGSSTDQVSYMADEKINNNGLSLQKIGDWLGDAFEVGVPTPGTENSTDLPTDTTETDNNSVSTGSTTSSGTSDSPGTLSSHSETVTVLNYSTTKKIKIGVGRKRLVSVFEPISFELDTNLSKGESAGFTWSFGDGEVGRGKKTEHKYKFPGLYQVIVRANSKKLGKAVSRTEVRVVEPKVSIEIKDFLGNKGLSIKNLGKYELNLGGFSVDNFEFPKDTIIKAGENIVFDRELIGVSSGPTTTSSLLLLKYPNDKVLATTTYE